MTTDISRRDFLGFALAGATTLALAGCASPAPASPAATSAPSGGSTPSAGGKTGDLAVGMKATLPSLTPLSVQGYQWSQMTGFTLYDSLIRITDTGTLEPRIAESWDTSDPTVTVINVRQGVKFQNGDPLTAKDVAYSIAVRSDPTLVAKTNSRPAIATDQFGSVEVVGDKTVKVHTKARVQVLTSPQPILIIPDQAFDKYNLATTAVGSGPFTLSSFTPDSRIELAANPNYWAGGPKINKLSFQLFKDVASAGLNLTSGQIDALYDVLPLHLKEVQSVPNKQVVRDATYTDWWIVQMGKPPLNDPAVRQALRYCFDRKQLNQASFAGLGTDTWNPFTMTSASSGVDVKDVTFDPQKAKQLLAAAGAANISVPLLGIDSYEDSTLQGQILQEGFRAAGIDSSYSQLPLADWIKKLYGDGSWEGLAFNAGTLPFPPSNYVSYLYDPAALKSAYTSGPPNPKMADLSHKVLGASDAEQPDLLKQVQQAIVDDASVYFMFGGPVNTILPKNLAGFATNGVGDVWWDKASFS